MKRPLVGRLDDACSAGKGSVDVAHLDVFIALHRLRIANMLIKIFLLGKRRFGIRPGDLEPACGAHRIPLARRDEANEIFLPDDFYACDIRYRGFVHFQRYRARHRRPQHTAVQHAGQFDIDHRFGRAEELGGDVAAAGTRFTDDFVVGR